MARSVTYDSLALGIMLSDAPASKRNAKLAALRQHAAHATGETCPDCGGTDTQDNGASGSQLVNLCVGCGHQWGPGTEC